MKDINMTPKAWEAFYKNNPHAWLRAYKHFMYCNHECYCGNCPENRGMAGNGRLPCGQYHCMVDICRNYEEE